MQTTQSSSSGRPGLSAVIPEAMSCVRRYYESADDSPAQDAAVNQYERVTGEAWEARPAALRSWSEPGTIAHACVLAGLHMAAAEDQAAGLRDGYEVGMIARGAWGIEQTNIQWFLITKRSGAWVTLQPLACVEVDCAKPWQPLAMAGWSYPGAPDTEKKPIRRQLCYFDGMPSGCKFHNFSGGGWIRAWDGRPVNYSSYA